MVEKLKKNLIFIVIVVVAFLIGGGGTYFYLNQIGKIPELLTPQQAADKAINYINQNLLQQGMTASLVGVTEENGIYRINLKVGENEFESYVTENGKILFVQGIDLDYVPPSPTPTTQGEEGGTTGETTKQDIPDVKLFVMSYCPYGLQAQKMFLPVYNLLKDKVKMGVYFVNYIMHGKQEIDENLRQYCIQKEEKEKYYSYLSCFVQDGNSEKCLSEANINREKMNTCISETDTQYKITQNYNDKNTWVNGQFPKFDVNTDLNEKYGVQGSPTIVINDKVVNLTNRSPEAFKEIVCQAFSNPPAECSQTLSNEAFSTGFGTGTGTSGSGGGCAQ